MIQIKKILIDIVNLLKLIFIEKTKGEEQMLIIHIAIIILTIIFYKNSELNYIQCLIYTIYSLLILCIEESQRTKKKRTNPDGKSKNSSI